jgi:hypothetical protein
VESSHFVRARTVEIAYLCAREVQIGEECTVTKFRVKMKLQGLELEIEGAREDASLISRNIGDQISALMRPAGAIIEGEMARPRGPMAQIDAVPHDAVAKKSRKRKASNSSHPETEAASAVDFNHSVESYGNPKQEWKTADKSLWLLFVLRESMQMNQLSTRVIVETFNKHFKQSGTVTTSNVTRDLGRLKTKERPAPIGEDTTKSPSEWFLTEEGIKRAKNLTLEALGGSGQ